MYGSPSLTCRLQLGFCPCLALNRLSHQIYLEKWGAVEQREAEAEVLGTANVPPLCTQHPVLGTCGVERQAINLPHPLHVNESVRTRFVAKQPEKPMFRLASLLDRQKSPAQVVALPVRA